MKFAERPCFFARLNSDAGFRALIAFFVLILLIFAIVPLLHCLRSQSIKDYLLWHQTGQLVWQGKEIYPLSEKFDFMYPPPCALFLAPISLLGRCGLIFVLVLLNGAAWIAAISFSVYLATGKWRRQDVLFYVAPNLAVIIYVWSNFHLGQPTLLLLALLLGAFICLQRNRHLKGGALIALAVAIKAFPLLTIMYLVYRRYWIAAGSLLVALAFLLALSVPFRGAHLAGQDLQRWASGMLLKYDESGVGQRAGRGNAWKNQSIFGVANRMLRHVEYDFQWAPHQPAYANIADLEFSTVNVIIVGAALVLGLVYIGVMPRRAGRTMETDAIEFALLLLLILIFTPLSFGYLYAWLLYPFTVIIGRLSVGSGTSLLRWTVAALLLLVLTIPNPRMAQTYGSVFFATLLLFTGLANELWHLKTKTLRPESDASPSNHSSRNVAGRIAGA